MRPFQHPQIGPDFRLCWEVCQQIAHVLRHRKVISCLVPGYLDVIVCDSSYHDRSHPAPDCVTMAKTALIAIQSEKEGKTKEKKAKQ